MLHSPPHADLWNLVPGAHSLREASVVRYPVTFVALNCIHTFCSTVSFIELGIDVEQMLNIEHPETNSGVICPQLW